MSNNIELMQHALGINERNRQSYRNYFLAGDGHADNSKWQELVSDGCATSRQAPDFVGGGVLYHVTDKGEALAIAALPEPKKRTRYEEYQHADCGNSFAEWLGINSPEFEYRETGFLTGKYEYRMLRRCWDYSADIAGNWCDTKKAAKASYKEALKKHREDIRDEQ
jgi:hypothetical protein